MMTEKRLLFVSVVLCLLFQGNLGHGQILSPDVRVNDLTPGGKHLPAIALCPNEGICNKEIYIVWVDCRSDLSCQTETGIFFSKSLDDGASFSSVSVLVSHGSSAFANSPKIAVDTNGTIYVAWHDNRMGSDSWNIYLSKSTDGGTRFSQDIQVNESVPNTIQYEPALTIDASHHLYVSWTRAYYDDVLQALDYDIHMAKSADGGSSFGPSVKVNDGEDLQYKSSIQVGPVTGNVYVTWTDRRNGGISDIYFAKSGDGGATFTPNIKVNTTTDQSQGYPEMALDDDEVIYVVWNDSRRLYTSNSRDIFMAHSLDQGDSFEPEIRVNDVGISPEFEYLYPVVRAAGHGHVAVAWDDKRNGTWDVYLSRSDNGGGNFRSSWKVNHGTKMSQSVPSMAMDIYGFAYCTWRDRRSSEFEIYFASDHTVKSVVTLLTPNGGEIFKAGLTYPIEWEALAQAEKFNVSYSVDDGFTWTLIAKDITAKTYPWTVPPLGGNRKGCWVKVIGFDSDGKKVGEDKSASPFTLAVVQLISPNGGEGVSYSSYESLDITWTTHDTKKAIEKVKLYYTTNGGLTWKLITGNLTRADNSYPWQVPFVKKPRAKCKVKVVFCDLKGNKIGSDASDHYLIIQPP